MLFLTKPLRFKVKMKNLITVPFVFFCALLVPFSCQREESLEPIKGYITFSPEQKKIFNGRGAADDIPVAAVVSIRDEQGKFVYENHKLPLLAPSTLRDLGGQIT